MAEIMRAELEAAINSGSAEVLRASIQKAHPGDVDVSVLNLAHQVLVREDHKASACEKLRKACETRNCTDLVSAIHLAKAFDADAALIEVAESILAEERTKDIAKQRLHCAAQLRNARHLRAEIAACISCGMDQDDPEIGKAQTLLVELEEEERQQTESRRLVEERLRAAMSGGSPEELRAAIDAASKASLEVSLLNEAHLALVMRERQHRQVMQTLSNAVKARDSAALEEAIAEATKHEVADPLLQEARDALEQARQQGAVEGELDQAMQAKDLGALEAAVAKAVEAGVRQDKLSKAKEMLDESSRRGSARERLDELLQMESPDVSELRAALQDAREAGCEVAMINTAYTRLAIQERRTQAEAALAMALRQRDRIELHKAIAIAEGSGVSETSLAEAREALAVMERKADVCSRIRSAVNSGIIGYLEVAVREGREAGLQDGPPESSLLEEAELVLKRLQENHAEGEAVASESAACPLADTVAPAASEEAASTMPSQEVGRTEAAGLEEEDDDTITVDVRVWHQCPSCSGLFGSAEAVRAHWLRQHRPGARAEEASVTPTAWLSAGEAANGAMPTAQPSTSSPSGEGGAGLPSGLPSSSPSSPPAASSGSSAKKQKCPSCEAIFDSVEEARAHWLQQHHPQGKAAAGAAAGQTSTPQPATTDSNKGEVIVACDETGKAVVVRKVDEETKATYTVVLDEDGLEKKFGEKTVQSMADSVEDQVWAWLGKMSRWQLRGVAHEVTQRVMEGSQRYHSKRENLQKLSQRYNLVYFGLSSDATEKDLDAAYRRMAKTLHPDKHGGSEAAKERFQKMKARYEHLKQSMSGGSSGGGTPAKSSSKSGGGGGSSSRKAEDKDEEDKKNAKSPEQQDTEEPAAKDNGDRAEEATGEERSDGANEESDSCGPSQTGASSGGAARREAYDEDEDTGSNEQEEEEDALHCDFNNRASVEKMVWKMLRQIKNIKTQEAALDAELQVYEGAMKSWATS